MKESKLKNKISVIGGDKRQIHMISELSKKGFEIFVYGIDYKFDDKSIINSSCLFDCLNSSDVIILPLPLSKDGVTVNAPLFKDKIYVFDAAASVMEKDKLVLAGMISENHRLGFLKYGLRVIDYFENEELNIQNAILTAEGAVNIAISETDYSLYKSNCLVTGYGRIGKALSKLLLSFGANVTVAARNPNALAWADYDGLSTMYLSDISEKVNSFDIIFNTVPFEVIDEKSVSNLSDNCFIIELASAPGGVNLKSCDKRNIKYNIASGLPGKISSKSAGIIICNTVLNIIKEENMWTT